MARPPDWYDHRGVRSWKTSTARWGAYKPETTFSDLERAARYDERLREAKTARRALERAQRERRRRAG